MNHSIKPIGDLLPWGTRAALARKYNLSISHIIRIANGINDRPEIYAEMLDIAIEEKKRREKMEKIRRRNNQLAKKL